MLKCISRSGSFLLMFLLLTVVCGCTLKGLGGAGISFEKPSVLASQAISADERIVATASIDVVSARGRYPVRAALILQKPSYLRFEILPVIGTPDFFLTATPSDMKIFIPSRGEFYSGKPTADNLAHFLPWAIGLEDLVMIFSGAYPPLSGNRLSYESYPENSSLRVNVSSVSGDSQSLWFTGDGKISKMIRKGGDGKEVYQVLYEDYAPSARVAGKITIRMDDAFTSISVRYSDMQIESSIDRSVFEMSAPPGSKTIQLN